MRLNDITSIPEAISIDDSRMNEPSPQNSFHDDDHKLIKSEKGRAKIVKTWRNSVVDCKLWIVDVGVSPDSALRAAVQDFEYIDGEERKELHGKVGAIQRLEMLTDYTPDPNAINFVVTNNSGANRLPLTGWIIAHRLLHAVEIGTIRNPYHHMGEPNDSSIKDADGTNHAARYDRANNGTQTSYGYSREVMLLVRNILEDCLYSLPSGRDAPFIIIAQELGTTAACRNESLNSPMEIAFEFFAQYILTGRVRYNYPDSCKIDGREDGVLRNKLHLSFKRLEQLFAQLCKRAVGKTFTL